MKYLAMRNTKLNLTLILTGAAIGLIVQLNWLAFFGGWKPSQESLYQFAVRGGWESTHMLLRFSLSPILFIVLLFAYRQGMRFLLSKFNWYSKIKQDYESKDWFVFLPTLILFLISSFGLKMGSLLPILFILIAQVLLLFQLCNRHNVKLFNTPKLTEQISILFFISGFAALIYQIVWQRLLFATYGTNIESVTMIVAIFILGLGLGSLFGGFLSKLFPKKLPLLFLACEVSIGTFGIFSNHLLSYVSEITVHLEIIEISIIIFMLLFIPTLFMGAILPILVVYLNDHYRDVGRSVSLLYFINTMGSAFASVLTVHFLFVYLNLNIASYLAASCNLLVGYFMYRIIKSQDEIKIPSSVSAVGTENTTNMRQYVLILLLSCVVGFISLSQEILWVRIIGYFTGYKATVFGNILAFFLMGIALGSLKARSLIKKYESRFFSLLARILLISAISFYTMIPVAAWASTLLTQDIALLLLLSFVGITAYLLGIIFPVLCCYASPKMKSLGVSVSWIYFSNILGSTAGPLFTGFILLEKFTTQQIVLFFSFALLALSLILWLSSEQKKFSKQVQYAFNFMAIALLFALSFSWLYKNLFEMFYYKRNYFKNGMFTDGQKFRYNLQNRNGILSVLPSEHGDDIMVGGGMYDGRFNTDLVLNSNGIDRAYIIPALHPSPRNILVIGLGTGSWVKVLTEYEGIKKIDVIELNPNYVELVEKYPTVSSILNDPKVSITIDDGRRWLKHNPKAKYDFILMNTTYHFRCYVANLLSVEFLKLLKAHLNPGGVIHYNTTGSLDVPHTAVQVFNYLVQFSSFITVSERPFDLTQQERRNNLQNFKNITTRSEKEKLMELADTEVTNQAQAWLSRKYLFIITDNNLASEFKTQGYWYFPQNSYLTRLF